MNIFFDFSGSPEAWPKNYGLILFMRFFGLGVIVFGTYFLKYFSRFIKKTKTQRTTICLILTSVLMGLDYVLFQVSVTIYKAMNSGELSIHFYYGGAAAIIFIFCQVMAAIDLSNSESTFIKWLLPAAIYLGVIGVLVVLLFNNYFQLIADSARALVLLYFGVRAYRQVAAM